MKYYKIIIFTIIIYILACFSTYFSMQEYSNEISSSCFDCSYERDVFLLSIYSSVILLLLTLIIVLLKKRLNKKWNISIFLSIIFILLVFFNNYNIFSDRVSSWSSYNTAGEFLSVLSCSYLYLGVSAILIFILVKFFRF